MKRRKFIKASITVGAGLAVPEFFSRLAAQSPAPEVSPPAAAGQSPALPWQREVPLRVAAQSVMLESTLHPTNPMPDTVEYFGGPSMTVNNLKMRTTIWGTPDRVTISLNKNNVWDRRLNVRSLKAPTLEEITEGAFSPANKDYVGRDTGKDADTLRPKNYGYLLKDG
ncbi:MAG: hypothetical protein ABSE62_16145, partial [Chthoniobacteraceae bacterium]